MDTGYQQMEEERKDKLIADLQAENAELAELLTEGCNGFGSVLIQTSDMAGVNDWRKRVIEYLLIKKHRRMVWK